MKYQARFQDQALARPLIDKIRNFRLEQPVKFMEVCGTHTMAIHQFGLKSMLPANLHLLSGPGCPVCVTPVEYLDKAVTLAQDPKIIITTFGDMLRVPGSYSDLRKAKALGGKIQIVYSPLEALKIAESKPGKEVVFLGVGFETTLPGIALAIKEAERKRIKNFSVLTSTRTIPSALKSLAGSRELALSGFILPGHVSCIIGETPYQFLASEFGISGAITGFEPLDLLYSLYELLKSASTGEAKILNLYPRAVRPQGNLKAQALINEIFEPCAINWRGIGNIPESGLQIKAQFADYSADKRFPLELPPTQENPACRCGEILSGIITPLDCPLFGKACTPEEPIGACMVSSEGTCAAYYKYGN